VGPHRGEVAELDPSLNFRLLGLGFSEEGGSFGSLVGVARDGKGASAPGCSHQSSCLMAGDSSFTSFLGLADRLLGPASLACL